MFNEGVDLPNVDTILMLRPTESRILWLQQFGRGATPSAEAHMRVADLAMGTCQMLSDHSSPPYAGAFQG
jgi:superfamily II DNA or RNA helicase